MKTIAVFLTIFTVIYGNPSVLFSPVLPDESVLRDIPFSHNLAADPCSDPNLKNCENVFNTQVGISSDADWENVDVLIQDVQRLLNKSVDDGLLKLCRARSAFYQCLGTSYSSCMDRFYFLEHGQNFSAATAFVQVFKELEFMCNGGLLQSIQKWSCIRKYRAAAEKSLQACLDIFRNNTNNITVLCDNAEQLMLCWRLPYYVNCGEDVAWWSCEQARVALDIDQYCPHLSCSYSTYGPTPAPTSAPPAKRSNSRLLTRRELFRSPNPQFMSVQKMNLILELGAKAAERQRRKREAGLPEEE